MSYSGDIATALAGLNKWQGAAVAAMCAASMVPMIERFAQPATRQAFKRGLDTAWKSAREGALDSGASAARATLDELPESMCDDSNTPMYEVMVALGVLSYALDAVNRDDSVRNAKEACFLAANHYSGYDHVLVYGNQIRTIDPRNPPPPGRLESLQIQSQLHAIEIIRNARQLSGKIIEELQASAAQLASELDRVLPIYAQRRGWKIQQ